MSPSLLYLKPLRNSKTFLHVIYKSKKTTNLLCIKNNVSQYSKIRTRKRNATKSIETEKKFGIQPFLESGIHCAGIRNPVLGIRNPQSGIQNPRLPWISLYGAILNTLKCVLPTSFRGALVCNYSALMFLVCYPCRFLNRADSYVCGCFRIAYYCCSLANKQQTTQKKSNLQKQ